MRCCGAVEAGERGARLLGALVRADAGGLDIA